MYINPLAIATALDEAEGGSSLVARQYRQRSRGRRLATGAIVGIAIACFLVVAFCLFCCWFCCFRKKRGSKRAGHQQPISGPTSHGGGGGFFSKFRPGNGAPPPQGHYAGGPAMQQNGYGAQPGYGGQQYGGYNNGGVAQPQPAYR